MEKKLFVFLVVLVISLFSAEGTAAIEGWQENPDTWPAITLGGTFNISQDGKVLVWHDVNFLNGYYVGDMYWMADVNAPCPTNYPFPYASTWGLNLSYILGWNDPQWEDGFKLCTPEFAPVL